MLYVVEPPLDLDVWVLHEVSDLCLSVVLHVSLRNAIVMGL